MDKIYWLCDSSDGKGSCQNLEGALKDLGTQTHFPLGYITTLCHVILLESGFCPKDPIKSQWNRKASSVSLNYTFSKLTSSGGSDEGEEEDVIDFTLRSLPYGPWSSSPMDESQNESFTLHYDLVSPSEYVDYSQDSPVVKFHNLPKFSKDVKNKIVLPIVNALRVLWSHYPGLESLEILPNEILIRISEYLPQPRDFLNMETASKRLQGLLREQQIVWKYFYLHDFPLSFADMDHEEINDPELNWREKYRVEYSEGILLTLEDSFYLFLPRPSDLSLCLNSPILIGLAIKT
ncbi:Fbox protein 7 [Caligus rogercresseyi]|uniref:Fbox protein 7 n=1 Tax=Caligus rogercresseyi TaxID=217165 RepID=A0A7T8HHL5_CALRO|nr:Fbox protein 7 [Caligus rogercresseyi]